MAASETAANEVDKLLKRVYEPEFDPLFNEEALGFQLATKGERRDFEGGKEIIGMIVGRAKGVGFRGETDALPNPGAPTYVQSEVPLKRFYGTLQLSHDLIELSKGQGAAFREALPEHLEQTFRRMVKQANFAFLGDGRGILAKVSVGGTLDPIVGGGDLQITVDTTRYLEGGDIIALWVDSTDTSAVLINGGQDTPSDQLVTIKSVDTETLVTINTTAAAGKTAAVVSGNTIRLYGDKIASTTAGNQVFSGLGLFADDGTVSTTFQGITRSSFPRTKGQIIDAGSKRLSRRMLYDISDKVRKASGMLVDTLIFDTTVRNDYLDISRPDIRFEPVSEADVGYSEESLMLSLGTKKVQLITDVDCPYGKVYAFAKSKLFYMERNPLHLDDTTGSPLKQSLPFGSVLTGGAGDVFYAYLRMKGNFATSNPASFGRIENLDFTLPGSGY